MVHNGPMTSRVTMTVDDGVADVRLNRPDKLNALDAAMFDAILRTGEQIAADPGIRVVVLSGEGRGFCAGLDAASLGAMAGAGTSEEADPEFDASRRRFAQASGSLTDRLEGKPTNLFQQVAYVWSELAVPVLAACHGPVLGGGLQIALGADIRFTSPDAKWSVLEIRWGLLPDMTGIQQLVRVAGLDVVKELAFTGRILSGTEAVRLGLATHESDDPRADAWDLARELCTKNPDALRGMKTLCNAAGSRALTESLTEESRMMGELIGSPNQVEATMAHLEKRTPRFQDPQ